MAGGAVGRARPTDADILPLELAPLEVRHLEPPVFHVALDAGGLGVQASVLAVSGHEADVVASAAGRVGRDLLGARGGVVRRIERGEQGVDGVRCQLCRRGRGEEQQQGKPRELEPGPHGRPPIWMGSPAYPRAFQSNRVLAPWQSVQERACSLGTTMWVRGQYISVGANPYRPL